MKAIVVGRHSGEVPGVEIIAQEDVTFPATAQECWEVIEGLIWKAQAANAALLFQTTPGQVAAALVQANGIIDDVAVGVIVNKPGERLAGVVTKRPFHNDEDLEAARELVIAANPRAKVEVAGLTLIVTCDPPMRFEFSHIEWLSGNPPQ